MADRCKIFRLSAVDIDRAVDDPALGLMLSKGWSVIAPIVIEEKGEMLVALIMAPPIKDSNALLLKTITASIVICAISAVAYMSSFFWG